jgi:hypothetical protein
LVTVDIATEIPVEPGAIRVAFALHHVMRARTVKEKTRKLKTRSFKFFGF